MSAVQVYSEPVDTTLLAWGEPTRHVQAPSYGWCCFACGAERRGYRALVGADSAADQHVCGCPTGNGEA